MEYSKNLAKPEARHRYWHIYKSDRDFFPESLVPFKLKFHDTIYELQVNHKDDIMTGKLYEKYRFLEGDKIIVTKKKKNQYQLEASDTKLYPEIE